MCGIIGYVSEGDCCGALFDALRRLEYRGYDSAGIAVLGENGFSVCKKQGGVSNLASFYAAGNTGIGHTRWATHGAPSDENAHPHRAGKIALVHNGIVENYAALKAELEADGELFLSETDSEVIAKLISRAYRGDLLCAVHAALGRAEGAYAVAVIAEDRPGEIVAARYKSPLIAGCGREGLFVCSDIPAVAAGAGYIAKAEDGEFVRIADGEICFYDRDLRPVPKVFFRPQADLGAAPSDAGGYCMRREIGEIPAALRRTFCALEKTDFAPCARALRGAKRIFAVACGTAYHSALAFRDAAERDVGVPVLCCTAGEFRYRPPLTERGDLVVAVSQSGETADTLEAVRLAKERGGYVVAVTNAGCSSLASLADFTLVMRAGAEIAVAATKSYNCQLLCLWYLAAEMLFFKRQKYPDWFSSLQKLPSAAEEAISLFSEIDRLADSLKGAAAMYFLGRGADECTAREGALKVKEIACVFAEGLAAGELKHGPLALVREGFPVFMTATQPPLFKKCENALAEVRSRGGFAALFSQSEEALSQSCADVKVRLPALPAALMPCIAVIPLQYFAYRMCLERGLDPDKPKNLAKSVTVE